MTSDEREGSRRARRGAGREMAAKGTKNTKKEGKQTDWFAPTALTGGEMKHRGGGKRQ